jgi:putative membrane protein insertion efficiency factor
MRVIGTLPRSTRHALGIGTPLLVMIRAYRRFVSPIVPRACRFEPSCSAYAEEALSKHPAFAAIRLILSRVARCHPFHPGGYDPVP